MAARPPGRAPVSCPVYTATPRRSVTYIILIILLFPAGLYADSGDKAVLQHAAASDTDASSARVVRSGPLNDRALPAPETYEKDPSTDPAGLEMIEKIYGVGLEGEDERYLNQLDGSSLNDEVIWVGGVEYDVQPPRSAADGDQGTHDEELRTPFFRVDRDIVLPLGSSGADTALSERTASETQAIDMPAPSQTLEQPGPPQPGSGEGRH